MDVPPLENGQLPMGRWACTPEEVRRAFVDFNANSEVRAKLWSDWEDLLAALRYAVGEVAACWMAGSFLTDKAQPGDIDCVWLIDAKIWIDGMRSATPETKQFLKRCATGEIKGIDGMEIDSYVLEWQPSPGAELNIHSSGYLQMRGYWDDLWVRVRDGSDRRLGSIPRRGYLEVVLDGYK